MSCAGQASEHDADHCEPNEGSDGAGVSLEIARQTAIATDQASVRSTIQLGQDDELVQFVALDDLDHPMAGSGCGLRDAWSLIAGNHRRWTHRPPSAHAPRSVIKLASRLPTCVMAMEACCGAHHLGRVLQAHGHEVRLMSPEYVQPYVKAQKNDERDAEAIVEAAAQVSNYHSSAPVPA
jgi:hypothetical protein